MTTRLINLNYVDVHSLFGTYDGQNLFKTEKPVASVICQTQRISIDRPYQNWWANVYENLIFVVWTDPLSIKSIRNNVSYLGFMKSEEKTLFLVARLPSRLSTKTNFSGTPLRVFMLCSIAPYPMYLYLVAKKGVASVVLKTTIENEWETNNYLDKFQWGNWQTNHLKQHISVLNPLHSTCQSSYQTADGDISLQTLV